MPTLSLCITAHDRDIHLLDRCLYYINKQTVKPDEIILLASNIKHWSGDIKINTFISTQLLSAGRARNKLLQISSSDIMSFCDIDDEIHPQKCEIVKHIFTSTSCCALVHDYEFGSQEFNLIDLDTVKTHTVTDVDSNPVSTNLKCPIDGKIAHGPISLDTRFILSNNLYYQDISNGEDGLFCRNILNTTASKLLYTNCKLINYIR